MPINNYAKHYVVQNFDKLDIAFLWSNENVEKLIFNIYWYFWLVVEKRLKNLVVEKFT